MNEWLEARKILAVRLDNMGDVVMLGPALRAVKETSPEAHITLLASPAGASIAPLLPWVDDVLAWRSIWQDVGNRIPFDPQREQDFIASLAARHFDAALIFTSFSQTPHTPGYVCYLAGIPLRAGESKEFGGSTLTTELRGAPDAMHQTERSLRLVEQLGFRVRDRRLALAIPARDRIAARCLLDDTGIQANTPYILLHPGASAQARCYPAARYGEVARLLTERGWPVLITGVEREADLLAEVMRQASFSPRSMRVGESGGRPLGPTVRSYVRTLPRATTPGEYAALVEGAALLICNDTLPMHLGDATNTPEVVLYSGTEYEEQWRPRYTPARLLRRDTPCAPCYRFTCPIGLPCLDIPAEEVVAAAEEMLAQTDAGVPSQVVPLGGSQ